MSPQLGNSTVKVVDHEMVVVKGDQGTMPPIGHVSRANEELVKQRLDLQVAEGSCCASSGFGF